MADVFISHASADRDGSAAVRDLLSDGGFTVWWDDHLSAGERFQEAIVGELNDSRAVVVLWTQASVSSDWVYSEARRANQQHKLVQVRSREVSIDDLPAPFDAFHCPLVDDERALLDAVRRVAHGDRGRPTRGTRAAGPGVRHLSPPRSAIVGRVGELEELCRYVANGDRLVTLTGPGGTGKTRLAAEVARQSGATFTDGAAFVPLETVTEPAGAWGAIGQALDLPAETCNERGVVAALDGRPMLLVLDNLEQFEQAPAVVDVLLEQTPAAILATSRRALHVPGEREHAVPPLELPEGDGIDAIAASGAVQLFVDFAQRAHRHFELTEANADDVAELCRRLDGLPLAIELIATRVKLLTPAALVQRVSEVLDLASFGGARDRRQATIRSAIAWSYDLLSGPQQHVLDCLGVFEGGAVLDAVRAVAAAEDLEGREVLELVFDLVDSSLVQVVGDDDGEPRFRLLETVRMFARDRLSERGVLEERVAAHAQFFYDLGVELHDHTHTHDHGRFRGRLIGELGNLRTVLAARSPGVKDARFYQEPVPWSHVASLVADITYQFGRAHDAHAMATQALEQPDMDPYGQVALCVTIGYIRLQWGSDDVEQHLDTTVQLARRLPTRQLPDWVEARNNRFLGVRLLTEVKNASGQRAEAHALCDELVALASEGTVLHKTYAHQAAYVLADAEGDFERAHHFLELQREGLVNTGNARGMIVWINNMADLEIRMGRSETAARRLAASADQIVALGDVQMLAFAAETFGEAIGSRLPLWCARLFGAAQALRAETGLRGGSTNDHGHLSEVEEVRALVPEDQWTAAYVDGQASEVADVLIEAATEVRVLPAGFFESRPQ